jgi:hypothetical protein
LVNYPNREAVIWKPGDDACLGRDEFSGLKSLVLEGDILLEKVNMLPLSASRYVF